MKVIVLVTLCVIVPAKPIPPTENIEPAFRRGWLLVCCMDGVRLFGIQSCDSLVEQMANKLFRNSLIVLISGTVAVSAVCSGPSWAAFDSIAPDPVADASSDPPFAPEAVNQAHEAPPTAPVPGASHPQPDAVSAAPVPGGAPSSAAPANHNGAPVPAVATQTPNPAEDEHLIQSNLKHDLGAVSSLSLAGWEAQSPVWMTRTKGTLVAPEGVTVPASVGASRPLLLEYGCTDFVSRSFHREGASCHVDLYHFAKADGAYGAYSTLREGSSNIVLRGQASSEDDNCISFWKGSVFAKLKANSENDEEAKSALTKLADELVKRIEGTGELPLVLRSLPSFEKVKGSEKFFMGTEAAHRYLNVPFIETLYLTGSDGAAHADYQFASPISERLGLLAINYKSATLAQSSFKSYVDNITAMSNKVLQRTDNEALCRVSDSFLLCQLNGQKLIVISGARKKFSPGMLARQLH